MKKEIYILLWVMIMGVFSSCEKPSSPVSKKQFPEIPLGFPGITYPQDNIYTPDRWALGKMLFYDPVMSIDSSISCATCHQVVTAFATNSPTNEGVENRPGVRNAPSLANVAYYPYFLSEGSVPTLEMQVLVPIQEHNEFDYNIVDLARKLQTIPRYQGKAEAAYNRSMDAFVITRAIANFERSIISGHSAYDQYLNGLSFILTEVQKKGMDLFFSERTQCASCHSGQLFTNFEFKNNGLATVYADSGRIRFTGDPKDRGLFKTPSLRNVAVTYPYMHDGSLSTLEEVVAHYNSGGAPHPNKSNLIQPLGLSDEEQDQLVRFLESLTDYRFLNNSTLSQ